VTTLERGAVPRGTVAPKPERRRVGSLWRALGGSLGLVAVAVAIGAVGANQPVIALGSVIAGLAATVVAIRPDAAAIVVVGLIYSNAPVVMVTFHDLPVALAGAVPAILAAPLAYDLLVRRERVVVTPALPWIVAYFVVEVVATIFARDINGAATSLQAIAIEGLALYILLTNTIRTPEILRWIVWTLLIVGAAIAAISVYQYLTGTFGNNYFGFAQTESSVTGLTSTGVERLAGPIGEKNRYAQIMLMLVPIGFMAFVAEKRLVLRLAALGSAALTAIAMALTFSRGAAVAAGVVLLAMVVLRYIRLRYLVAALGIAAVVLVAVPQYADRVLTLGSVASLLSEDTAGSGADNSLLSRATENLTAINVFADHPLVGVGPGQFSEYYRQYSDEIGISVRAQDREAHNLYLGLAAEAGSLGLAAFLVAVVVTLVGLARARRAALATRPDLAALATGFLLAIIAYLASGVFLHLSYARYFWLMLALGGVAAIVVRAAVQNGATPGSPSAAARSDAVRGGPTPSP
jgi:putative inorganic carbon (HCO3(-)) transporter